MEAASAYSRPNTDRVADSTAVSNGSFHSPSRELRPHDISEDLLTMISELNTAWEALRFGGAMVYPLLLLGVFAIVIILDRGVAYSRCLRLPAALLEVVETYGFSWDDLEHQISTLSASNAFGRFFTVIANNR